MPSATVIGSQVTSATISTGSASANFTLPGGTAAGTYTIEAAYGGGTNFIFADDFEAGAPSARADAACRTASTASARRMSGAAPGSTPRS